MRHLLKKLLQYDAEQNLHRLTGDLHAAGLLPPRASLATTVPKAAERLGACAARLLELDASYQLDEARRFLDRSRDLAEKLPASRGPFSAKMQSHWFTAAGRVLYRLRDFPAALEDFKRASIAANTLPIRWGCLSDELRCQLEVVRAFADPTEATNAAAIEYRKALRDCLHCGSDDKSLSDALVGYLTRYGLSEQALGALNLFHNLCDAGGIKELPMRRRVVRAAFHQGERYRSLQLLHGILSAQEKQGYRGCVAKIVASDLGRLEREGLPRTAMMAKQRRAAWLLQGKNDRRASLRSYRDLLKQLSTDRKTLGSGYFHHDVHNFTLAGIRNNHPREVSKSWFHDESLALIESLRSLISLPLYKHSFAEWSKPLLYEVANSLMPKPGREASTSLEELVTVAEMGSCRELLDVLAARAHSARQQEKGSSPSSAPAASGTRAAVGKRSSTRKWAKVLGLNVLSSESDLVRARKTVERRARALERASSGLAVASAPHDPDVLYKAKQQSLGEDTLFLRYIVTRTKSGANWGVVAIWNGGEYWFGLEGESIESLVARDWSAIKFSPHSAVCEQIWTALLAPVWSCLERGEQKKSWKRVVVVPADALWRVPFQAALMSRGNGRRKNIPLAVKHQVVLATSLTAYVTHGRSRLERFVCAPEQDDFVAVNALPEPEICDHPQAFNWVLGMRGWHHVHPIHVATSSLTTAKLLDNISKIRPEFLYWLGHGTRLQVAKGDAEVVLQGPDGQPFLTTFDLLMGPHFGRNKLCVIASCMAAGGDTGQHGELRGFIRALQGAGAGAILMSHWQICAARGPEFVQKLFESLTDPKSGPGIAERIRRLNKRAWKSDKYALRLDRPMRSMPFCLIL